MAERDRPHIVVPMTPRSEPFTIPSSGGSTERPIFSRDRRAHGNALIRQYESAVRPTSDEPPTEGTYLSFLSFPGLELALKSLDVQSSGEQPELVVVSEMDAGDGRVQVATVYIPDGKKQHFLKRLTQYVETADADKARHADLVEGIQEIRRATIRQLWTDADDAYPADPTQMRWWEVWLRKRDGHALERFTAFAAARGLRTSEHYLGFGDRTVVLVHSTADQLADAFRSLDDIAELRQPHDVQSFLSELPASEQAEWVEDLRGRLRPAGPGAPVVCILDTGVQDSHPLLTDSIAESDMHVAHPLWQLPPVHRHGTEMAGLALYGDVHRAVQEQAVVELRHRLESVKILPDRDNTDQDLYGAITARAVDRPEIQAADRPRVFMLAVTAEQTRAPARDDKNVKAEAGKPTSWSAAIDALAFGRAIDDTDPKFTYLDRDEPPRPRLFVVSAGNIRNVSATDDHLERSILEPVEDPAQAWNALTVGAYSAKDDMSGAPQEFAGYKPIAPRGELSPVSRTSVLFDSKKWPFKPDVVADGGNLAASPDKSTADTPENLALLTTRFRMPGEGFFTTTRDTSAATATVAAIAADIYAAYPDLRPETVRALIVHSAQWTDAMQTRFDAESNKTALAALLRCYGMGVPDADRALYSAADALTLVAEATIHPYEREGNSSAGRTREMNLHELPWPTAELEALGSAQVRMRVTLSYFVEPNPSSRGWTGRYIYPSHGLRFATRRPDDSVEAFRQRVNARARLDEQKPLKLRTEQGWMFGSNQQQAAGSLHTDIWSGNAVDLASKGAIAVYPVAGWWKNRPHEDQSEHGVHYSLIVSIESPEIEVDLWTPVYQQVYGSVEIPT
ncbi:S8 family peptidase [Microbacterium soli]|uniref:S8 family peptidase n=1 Tax=Microbacterium soli TaxID=446075 RepID=A0ABP7MZ29_9MICO